MKKALMHKLLLALACASCAALAEARVCVWTGGGTTEVLQWSDSANWEDGAVPQDGDTVSFDAKSATQHRLDKNLTLENLFYTNSLGATFNCLSDRKLTLTGAKSEVVASGMNWLASVQLANDAKLKISGAVAFKSPCDISGSGEIEKVGTGNLDFYKQNTFAGTWHLRNGQIRTFGSMMENPLGSSGAVAHIYGSNEATGADATFQCNRAVSFDNRFFFHDVSVSTYQTAVFNGDLTFVSEQKNNAAFYLDGSYKSDYHSESSPPGFIINGNVICDNSVYTCRVLPRANGVTDYFIKFNGALDLGTRSLELAAKTDGTDYGTVYVNSPISTSAAIGLIASGSGTEFHCGAANVLGGSDKDLGLGIAKKSSSALLDLCGHDQMVRRLWFVQDTGCTTSGSITSSGGPATLFSAAVYNGTEHHNVFSLDGEVSLSLKNGNANQYYPFVFSGGTTTGWIFSDYNSCDLTAAAFPNLGGIALEGAGIAHVGATTALKNGVKFEFRSLTTGHLQVDSGVSINAAQVLVDATDVPAGTYCRPGAGIAGATEAAWLGGGEGCDGTVTVAAHDPRYIWTGNGADGLLSTPANWSGGVAPDLSSASATIDFRYASAAKPITLSGTVAPACAIVDATPFEKGSLKFDGNGSLALSGSGVTTNDWVFSDHASLVWNGPGTLVLLGASSTTGTVSVAAGKVVIAAGEWLGGASVAANAELEVEPACGSGVFGEDDANTNHAALDLDGRLTLGDGVAARVKSMTIGGASTCGTYGSSSSAARHRDDAHFGGAGTVSTFSLPGMMIIFH